MKKSLVGGIILASVLISWSCGKSKPPAITTEATKTADAVRIPIVDRRITDAEVGKSAVCPVMGTAITITKDTLSAEYNGKIYYFCCSGCPEEFKTNPDKFAK